MTRNELIHALEGIFGRENVLWRPADLLATTPVRSSTSTTLGSSPAAASSGAFSSCTTLDNTSADRSASSDRPNRAAAAATAASRSAGEWTSAVTSSARARWAALSCGASAVCRARSSISARGRSLNTLR